jgi:hypothetical protein
MATSSLLNVPKDQRAWQQFSFNNREAHDAIRQAILDQRNIRLPDYDLEPINPQDLEGWLERHAQTHIEMNAALGSQGQDLQQVDFRDERQLVAWVWAHWLEHNTANQILRI